MSVFIATVKSTERGIDLDCRLKSFYLFTNLFAGTKKNGKFQDYTGIPCWISGTTFFILAAAKDVAQNEFQLRVFLWPWFLRKAHNTLADTQG